MDLLSLFLSKLLLIINNTTFKKHCLCVSRKGPSSSLVKDTISVDLI